MAVAASGVVSLPFDRADGVDAVGADASSEGWAIQATPNPTGARISTLNAVSCVSARDCTAIGESSGRPLVERWNGERWAVQPTATHAPGLQAGDIPGLLGVSCVSPDACIAVGGYTHRPRPGGSPYSVTSAERWNGRRWAIQATPNPAGAKGPFGTVNSGLGAVSCVSADACMAIGSYSPSASPSAAHGGVLFERWDGTSWTIQPSPHLRGGALNGVSCSSSTACTAVGSTNLHAPYGRSFAARWSGTSWTIQTIPSPRGALSTGLTAVSCVAPDACTAVGAYAKASPGGFEGLGPPMTLAERWNGKRWAVQAAPNPASQNPQDRLLAVSCGSGQTCTAIGSTFSSTFTERWNGKSWAVQATPNPSSPVDLLAGVSCASARTCTAVGTSVTQSDVNEATLAERWERQH